MFDSSSQKSYISTELADLLKASPRVSASKYLDLVSKEQQQKGEVLMLK